jgi:signal transduction histidine kinase
LIAAMVVVALSFASAIWYFESSGRQVSGEVHEMLSNGVPSVEQLTQVRASLRDLDGALDQALIQRMQGQPADDAIIAKERRDIDEEIARYRQLPFYPGEQVLNAELESELAALDETLRRLRDDLRSGSLQSAHERENGEWRRQSDRVDKTVQALASFNINAITDHALRINAIRRQAALFGLLAGSGALALALAATMVAVWGWRRQVRMQEERAAELEMFSARVAHDLMSPLAAVTLCLGMTQSATTDEKIASMAGRALSTVKRVRTIVDGLLEFARSGGRPRPGAHAPVAQVLSDVVDEVGPEAQAAKIELTCAVPGPVEAACDRGVLTVLVTNLVNNAIKYMGASAERRIEVRATGDERVRIEVADTGPGLSPGMEEHAFEAWVRGGTGGSGLGLGLATVKRLAEAHGGSVGVSRLQQGTLFWFELPRA